ncbi:MAG: glycosyl hydrolase 53 family protein [Anaerolineales bacterium]|nr:glycosyl hydrolase 53 family protein [Anaerolineales bacterium]
MNFIKGLDASYVTKVEELGGIYKYPDGTPGDFFKILADHGVSLARFRVWNNPENQYCNQDDVLTLSRRAKTEGLQTMIDFHYSDYWADPSKQNKPAAWEEFAFPMLRTEVYQYTVDVLSKLIEADAPPDIVQIGNEITHGILWPDGKIDLDDKGLSSPEQWDKFTQLIKSGSDAVKEVCPNTKLMVQIASGDKQEIHWLLKNLVDRGVSIDLVGISFYHNWHGDFLNLAGILEMIVNDYQKQVVIAETSYPFTLDALDQTENVIGTESELMEGYNATVEGQLSFLEKVFQTILETPYNLGKGVIYWGGEWIAVNPEDEDGSTWENQALFDFSGKALPSLESYNSH